MSRRISIFGASFASGPVFEPETTAYMNAVGIPADGTMTIYGVTGLEVWQGVDTFIVTGKASSWWAKLLALYPYIGGSAATHRINMVNPSTYLGTFFGGMTHNANGATGNGINAYMATGLIPSALGAGYINDLGFGIYNKSNVGANNFELGAFRTTPSPQTGIESVLKLTSNDQQFGINRQTAGGGVVPRVGVPKQVGVSRLNGTQIRVTNDGITQVRSQNVSASGLPSVELSIWGLNIDGIVGQFSPRNLAMVRFHSGLTDAEELSLQNAAHALQVTLNRPAIW